MLVGFPTVATVEAHYVIGGLGSLVSEVVAERGLGVRVIRFGVSGPVDGVSGSVCDQAQRAAFYADVLSAIGAP